MPADTRKKVGPAEITDTVLMDVLEKNSRQGTVNFRGEFFGYMIDDGGIIHVKREASGAKAYKTLRAAARAILKRQTP